MKNDENQKTGIFGERIAARYLRRHGYTIKDRNWRTGHLELDIVAASWRHIAFVEVKTRTYTPDTLDSALPPGSAVGFEKKRLTRQAALRYLREHPTKKEPRMDVIEVFLLRRENRSPKVLKIHHLKGAY